MISKVVGSRADFDNASSAVVVEFLSCVDDIVENEAFQSLDQFLQHGSSSRLQHSVNVSYYSFLLSRMFGLDFRSAARAGMLHDLFLYDWRHSEEIPDGNHIVAHPIEALRNAMAHFSLNEIEKDAIVKHMWPLALGRPLYRESLVVSLADKYCCVIELCESMRQSVRRIRSFSKS